MNIITPALQVELVTNYFNWEQSGKNPSTFNPLLETIYKIKSLVNCPEDLRNTFNLVCAVTPELKQCIIAPSTASSSSSAPHTPYELPAASSSSNELTKNITLEDELDDFYSHFKTGGHHKTLSAVISRINKILEGPHSPQLKAKARRIQTEIDDPSSVETPSPKRRKSMDPSQWKKKRLDASAMIQDLQSYLGKWEKKQNLNTLSALERRVKALKGKELPVDLQAKVNEVSQIISRNSFVRY